MKTIKSLRSSLLEFITHRLVLPLIGKFRVKPKFPYTIDQLLKFPEHTLGKELALYLKKMNFKLLPNYEQHDCKHIILQYEMNEVGEARMQFYFLGNRHYTLPVIGTVLLCAFLMPEHWKQFRRDYLRGKGGKQFKDIDYAHLVFQNTNELRNHFNNKPI